MRIPAIWIALSLLPSTPALAADPVSFYEGEVRRLKGAVDSFQPKEGAYPHEQAALEAELKTTRALLERSKNTLEQARLHYRPQTWPVAEATRDLVVTLAWLGERRLDFITGLSRYGSPGALLTLLPKEGEPTQVKPLASVEIYLHASPAEARADLLDLAGRYLLPLSTAAGHAGIATGSGLSFDFVRDNLLVRINVSAAPAEVLARDVDALIRTSPATPADRAPSIRLADDVRSQLVVRPGVPRPTSE